MFLRPALNAILQLTTHVQYSTVKAQIFFVDRDMGAYIRNDLFLSSRLHKFVKIFIFLRTFNRGVFGVD